MKNASASFLLFTTLAAASAIAVAQAPIVVNITGPLPYAGTLRHSGQQA